MIAMVKGVVEEKGEGELIVLCSGIGLRLMCSVNTLSQSAPVGQEATLYTHMNVREDAMELYGFSTREERAMFRELISVSGIGPKSALFVLGSMPLSDLRMAILTGDHAALSRAPGVGKKTAQRIALELRDRVAKAALASGEDVSGFAFSADESPAQDALGEAMQALKALGYSPQEAAAALKKVKDQADTADELIRLALRGMTDTK